MIYNKYNDKNVKDKAMWYLIFILIITIIMFIGNKQFRVKTYDIESKYLPNEFDGVKIVFLTDLHNNSFGKNNQKLLSKIQELQPDYIMISGDMVVGRENFIKNSTLFLLKELSKRYTVYYAPGNHEQKLGVFLETRDTTYLEYLNQLKDMGIIYLENQSRYIIRGEDKIRVIGLGIDREYYAKEWNHVDMESAYLKKLIGDSKDDEYQVLLAHQPKYFDTYASWGADLVLSGHNHGGIAILPLLGGVISPSLKFFPKYDFGLFQIGRSSMVLSKGLGVHTIKIRVANIPELSLVILKKSC